MINFKQVVAVTETQRANLIESLIEKNLLKIEDAIWDAAKEGKYSVSYFITIPSCCNNEEGKQDILDALANHFDDNFELTLISPGYYLNTGCDLCISWYKKEED